MIRLQGSDFIIMSYEWKLWQLFISMPRNFVCFFESSEWYFRQKITRVNLNVICRWKISRHTVSKTSIKSIIGKEMACRCRYLPCKPDDLSSTPVTHGGWRKLASKICSLTSTYAQWYTHNDTQTYISYIQTYINT